MREVTLRYSEPLLQEAVRSFFFRTARCGITPVFYIGCALLVLCLVLSLAEGDRSWRTGAATVTLAFAGVYLLVIYLAHYRHTVGRFRQMQTPEATLRCEEEQFTLTSELGSATLPWSSVTDVWRFPRFWLLLLSPSQFITLPLDCLDQSTQDFITEKAQKPR